MAFPLVFDPLQTSPAQLHAVVFKDVLPPFCNRELLLTLTRIGMAECKCLTRRGSRRQQFSRWDDGAGGIEAQGTGRSVNVTEAIGSRRGRRISISPLRRSVSLRRGPPFQIASFRRV